MASKKILLLGLALMASLALGALEFNSDSAIGIHFGSSTGSGYAMRWFGAKNGLQATFGAYTLGSNKVRFERDLYDWDNEYYGDSLITVDQGGRETAVNLGVNYMLVLDRFQEGRVYIMGGGSYKYFKEKRFSMDYALQQEQGMEDYYEHYEQVPNSLSERNVVQHRWTVGAGPGFEWALNKQFRMAVELPITYNWKHNIVMWLPQAGLYYYFK